MGEAVVEPRACEIRMWHSSPSGDIQLNVEVVFSSSSIVWTKAVVVMVFRSSWQRNLIQSLHRGLL